MESIKAGRIGRPHCHKFAATLGAFRLGSGNRENVARLAKIRTERDVTIADAGSGGVSCRLSRASAIYRFCSATELQNRNRKEAASATGC